MADNKNSDPSTKKKGKGSDAKNVKAAAKIRAAQQQKRQRVQWSVGIVVLIVVGFGVLGLAYASKSKKTSDPSSGRKAASASLVNNLADVPISKIASQRKEKLAADNTFTDLKPIEAPALTADGKPKILYIGAEYCPYCAGERWAMIVALSKFGTFSDLSTTYSAAADNPPSVPTLSFYGSKYDSKYISFDGVETQTATGEQLEKLSAADQKILDTYNKPPYVAGQGGGIPFVNFGGKFIQAGATVDPTRLVGKTHENIAKEINGKGDIALDVNSTAGVFIKSICTLTKGQPGDVCKPIAGN